MLSKLELNLQAHQELMSYCKMRKILFLSTPFDLESVSFLNPLVPLFKISSSDITNIPLIKKIAKCRKPIILSTGASNIEEIKSAIKILKKGTKKIVIMHCILNYPTKDWNANLSMIADLKKNFPQYIIGYSDHTLPSKEMKNLTTAYILGARVIEKHFTINKKMFGPDHRMSVSPSELEETIKLVRLTSLSL